MLVDVHYEPSPLVPRLLSGATAGDAGELDMSHCYLRSMSPLHLQYLKNMGVTATLVVSLVREGRLWGLVAAHHYSPRNLRYAVRAACDLLAEVVSTRIATIENYAHAQVALMVRRLEPHRVNVGKRHVRLLPDGWTVVTRDHSLSAQWEHTVLITKDGCEVLTLGADERR